MAKGYQKLWGACLVVLSFVLLLLWFSVGRLKAHPTTYLNASQPLTVMTNSVKEVKPQVVVFIKQGCPDCEGVKTELNALAQDPRVTVFDVTSGLPENRDKSWNLTDLKAKGVPYAQVYDKSGKLVYGGFLGEKSQLDRFQEVYKSLN